MKIWILWVEKEGEPRIWEQYDSKEKAEISASFPREDPYGTYQVLGITEVEVPQPKVKRTEKRWSTKMELEATDCPWMLKLAEELEDNGIPGDPIEVTLTWEE